VACTTDNVVVRLDPTTWAVTVRVPTPTAPDDLVAGPDGRLRLVAQQGPTLVVIDPKTNAVLSQRVLGTLPQLDDRANLAVAATADATWVSSFSADAVHRLTTAERMMGGPAKKWIIRKYLVKNGRFRQTVRKTSFVAGPPHRRRM
jgi:streptogramin lyase